jgi:DNA-binding Lrp family transcriptional regulator
MATHNELLVLHHLKRYGPIKRTHNGQSIANDMADELGMQHSTLRYLLRRLEDKCLILRSYAKPQTHTFEGGANNPMIKLELVDPDMVLEPIPQVFVPHEPPKPLPLAVTMERENRELEERIDHSNGDREPSVESIVDALIDRALELQKQVDKLQNVIEGLNKENERLHKATAKPAHLSSRVQGVLTAEQWDNLRRKQ